MKDIENVADISTMVHTFYDHIRKDALLGEIFDGIIQDQWPVHLEKMVRFWQTVLLDEHTYFGSPFLPHARMPIQKVHFEQWKILFKQTVDSLFEGEKAERAKWQAERMAEMFLSKINYYQQSNTIPLQ